MHAILWNEWDPIGLGGDDGVLPDDEYDAYVWPVIAKIMSGKSIEQIADYLDWAANQNMGCPQPRERHLVLAQKLQSLRPTGDLR